MRPSPQQYEAAAHGRRVPIHHGRLYRAVRGLVRLVVLGGGMFFLLVILPAFIDARG